MEGLDLSRVPRSDSHKDVGITKVTHLVCFFLEAFGHVEDRWLGGEDLFG
jgi:hypothetical protein